MAKATVGRSGRISGITESIKMLENLQRYIRSDAAKDAIKQMQGAAFGMIDNAIYGSSYGVSLAQIFSRTRPRVNGKSVRGKGAGTPVLTGRLQNSLTSPDAPYSLYQRNVLNKGGISVRYGGDPQDPKTKEHYFPRPEGMYKFFADGLTEFEQAQTISKLNSDLAMLFTKKVREQLARKIRSSR
jgi:hypothetical protein